MTDDAELARERRIELRGYILGFVGAALLTAASFFLVGQGIVTGGRALIVIGVLALVQMAWQLRYFLHIDLKRSHRDDLQLVLFTGLIVVTMVGGTMWILFTLHNRMM